MKKWAIGVAVGLLLCLSALPAGALSADAIPYATYQYDNEGNAPDLPMRGCPTPI